MIRANHFCPAMVMNLAAKLADGHRRLEQVLSRDGTQAADEFRANETQLSFQVPAAV